MLPKETRRFPSWCGPVGLAIAVGIACFLAARLGLALLTEPNVVAALLAVSMTAVLAVLVAERQGNVAALKDSNDRLQLALDGAELGVWSVDLITGRFESDARDRQINGQNPEAPQKTLAEARALIHPDDLRNLDAVFAASARTGSSYKAEYRLATAARHTCQERWVEIEGTVVRGADGRPARLLGVTRDITRRKLTEQRLEHSERQYRELLGALPAAVFVTDAAGRITYCNQSAVGLWGVEPKRQEDKRCNLCRGRFADGTLTSLEHCPADIALKQGRVGQSPDSTIEGSDGPRIPSNCCPVPVHDGTGAIIGMVNMMMDLTERQENERAAPAEHNLHLSLGGKVRLDSIHSVPETTAGSSRGEWESLAHPEDLARIQALRSQAFQERCGEYAVEHRIVRQGEVRWIDSRNFIAYDRHGLPQRVIGVNIDVTERKRAEERQRVLLAELDHRVKNVLATVSAVASRTKDASGSMEEFMNALDGRIRSMASAHEMLSFRGWRGIPITELVGRELAAYATGDNVELDGPEMMLRPEAGQSMAMVIHELVTNAAKHGALSTRSGRVSVRWNHELNGSSAFVLVWQETGGPRIGVPKRFGFGSSVVRELIPYELGGTVDFSFAPEGIRCRLEIPFDRISSDGGHGIGPERSRHTRATATQ